MGLIRLVYLRLQVGILPGGGEHTEIIKANWLFESFRLNTTCEITYVLKKLMTLGIINKLLSPENFMEDLKLYCQDLANRAPIALTQVKKIIHQGLDVTLEEGLMLEQKAFNVTMNSKDAAKAMRSLLNSDENIEDVTKFKWEGE